MKRRTAIGALVGGLLAPLAGCGVIGAERYRFRMTVEVDTPSGVRTGLSVYEVKAWNPPKLLPEERSRDWSIRGEAVAVDLPGGRTLFALLKTVNPMRDDLTRMSMAALDPAFRNDVVESARRIVLGRGIRSSAEVHPSGYPMLVTFRNGGDPTSVERVASANLAVSFGPGISLRRIVVEVTKDEVTATIKRRLDALGLQIGHSLDRSLGVTANPSLAQQLGYSDFLRT